ncbi:MAG: flagellar hook assembly protein FlgD [Demequina sp.]|uniref:flagellar hook assembly protein FlgD n=1 Tax=Demequina sp. TaxID=2050685 RepID=UPI003A85C9D3
MTIDPTAATSTLMSGTTTASAPKQEMDSEVFMALLVAQLRNQDPSSPMDTTEMMSQQTQLASMEKLTELSQISQEQFALSMRVAAMGLVGQQVSYTDSEGTLVTGVASSASFADAVPTIAVGDESIALDRIMSTAPFAG